MKSRANLIVYGLVQGVYYRSTTSEKCQQIGLTGWVKNKPDRTVEIMAEGEKEDIQSLIDWCRTGPSGAKVTGVEIKWEDYIGEWEVFHVTY